MSWFAFGLGYCARRIAARGRLGPLAATARTPEAVAALRHSGVEAYLFGENAPFARSSLALVSIPPDSEGDPTLRAYAQALRGVPRVIYLSTVGVYGDAGGGWVDETTAPNPRTPRAAARVAAEAAWAAFGRETGATIDVLRLGGIYGPGRGGFERLREGAAQRVVKPGQVFNRIHVDDIAAAVETVAAAGRPGAIYNVVDGAPSPPQDAVAYAAHLLGVPTPTEVAFEAAALSPMARSFYEENRRVRNDRLRALGWSPLYPTFREGLAAVLAEENAA